MDLWRNYRQKCGNRISYSAIPDLPQSRVDYNNLYMDDRHVGDDGVGDDDDDDDNDEF